MNLDNSYEIISINFNITDILKKKESERISHLVICVIHTTQNFYY